jgi:hypothetical protein
LIDFWNSENSKYTDQIFWVKNWYLSFVTWFWVENIAYSAFCYINSANIYNSIFSESCQNIYFLAWGNNSYNIFYSKYTHSKLVFLNLISNSLHTIFRNKRFELIFAL